MCWGSCLHDNVKDDGDRGHGGINGNSLQAGAYCSERRIPLFCNGLTEVDLDYQEADVEHDARNDGAYRDNSPLALWKKSEIGDEQGNLEPEDARDVTVRAQVSNGGFVEIFR